jgi:hypothetical protein
MRFISKYGRYGVQITPQLSEAYASGAVRIIQEPVYAYFQIGLLERRSANSRWRAGRSTAPTRSWTKPPPSSPDYRIGVFDSRLAQQEYGWSDEVREHVEAVLSEHAARWTDLLVVPRTMVPPPWPLYDEYKGAPSALIRKLQDEGHDLSNVLAYEKAMQHREPIVAAIEAALVERPVEEEVLG